VQEAKGNPHCRQLSLRPKKTLVLRRGTTLSFSTSAGGIRGEDPEQNSPEKSSINQLPAKTFFSEILQSPLKCFLVLGKPRERESVFQAFRIFHSVSLSLPWLLVKQPSEARSMWHHHLCPSREEGTRCCFFLCGRKKGHHRTELPLLKLSLRTFVSTRFFGGLAKAKTLLKQVSSSFSDPLTPSQTTPYYNCTWTRKTSIAEYRDSSTSLHPLLSSTSDRTERNS
jgi:hypothetical protein